jgi:hypothetical protein
MSRKPLVITFRLDHATRGRMREVVPYTKYRNKLGRSVRSRSRERVRCIRASLLEPHDLMLEALQDVYVDQMRASQPRLCLKTRAVMP